MYKIDFNKKEHIHFIGIGGISMSGLALFLKSRGMEVTGSDRAENEQTEMLVNNGIKVVFKQVAENVTDSIDAFVYTAAISADNPELVAAKATGKPMLTRAEVLSQVLSSFKEGVCVSGTNGKTTTTSMLSLMLLNAEKDPALFVGAVLNELNGNFRLGNGSTCVAEACEYKDAFLSLRPTHEIILNIEEDHLDYFKNLENIRASFKKYIELVPENGLVIINGEIDRAEELTKDASCKVETYGVAFGTFNETNDGINDDTNGGTYDRTTNEAGNASSGKAGLTTEVEKYDYAAANISFDDYGCGVYDFYMQGKCLGRVHLGVTGRHNVSNSLPAIAMAMKLGVSFESAVNTLKDFHGAKRRFELKGTLGGIRIYDDYAHNPTEILATLKAASKCVHDRIITIFQPHTYTRTKSQFSGFVESLSHSDVVVLADIYAAREIDKKEISSLDIAKELKRNGKEVYYFPTFDEIENFLLKFSKANDLLITMGAGDVVKIGESLLGR
ncbi:MAG: UDP-N-acetylmuramate--L-alanine ligase [Lachnospiraceae bacterium]|nr:UDP-N-acetylmuramate--L-alanine ligase [Lachnospiraceae bacterium]